MPRYNYILITSFCLLLGCLGCSKNKKDDSNFTVKGTLENLNSPYFLIAIESPDSIIVDTIYTHEKGKFTYKGKVNELTMGSLYFKDKSWSTCVFLDKGWNIDIKGDANVPDLIMIKGGNINDDLTSFKKDNSELFQNKANLLKQLASETNQDIINAKRIDLKNVNFELINRAKAYVEANPEKIASVVLMQDFYKNNVSVETMENDLNLLKGEAANSLLALDLRKYVSEVRKSQPGVVAPDIELYKKDRKKADNLKSLRNKYVLLSFSSAEEDIYKDTISPMVEIYESLKKSNNIEFVSIVVDDFNNLILPSFIKWPVYFEKSGWASESVKKYNITEIPYHILISPEGYILERGIAIMSLPQKMKDLQNKSNRDR